MTNPNVRDQRLQSVLRLLDLDTGNIDGIRGPKTNGAIEKAAIKLGMTGQDPKDVQQALLDKLKDPLFRAGAIEKLKQIDKPTTSDVIAMQTVLTASQMGNNAMLNDSVSRLMNGKLNAETKFALENTENGWPNKIAAERMGISSGTYDVALKQGSGTLSGGFQNAVAGASPPNLPPTLEGTKLAVVKPVVTALTP
jgi:peptidoglycan hydrolase-like protein with peptidoglycan-binding domain